MLDEIDKKIIAELDNNSRQNFSQLAKKIGTSKEVARYRFEQLKEKGVILNCHALINTNKLGYLIHIVWIKFQDTNEKQEKEIITFLIESKQVGVVTKVFGKWDLVFGIWAKDLIEFNQLYKDSTKNFKEKIRDQMITIELSCNYKSKNFIYEKKIADKKIESKLGHKKLDERDYTIIKELAKNSRTSILELAEKIGVTAKAVAGRIKKLEKEKIIEGYTININYEKLGIMHYRIFLRTTNESQDKIMKYLESRKRVISVMEYIGINNLEFRLGIKNIKELQEEINELKKQFGTSIKEYDSVLFLSSFEVLNFLPI